VGFAHNPTGSAPRIKERWHCFLRAALFLLVPYPFGTGEDVSDYSFVITVPKG